MLHNDAKPETVTDLGGPYRGRGKGYGQAFFALTLAQGAIAMSLPWLDLRFVAKHSEEGHHIWLALATDLLCFGALLGFRRIYKGLGKQIAHGGPKASQLDSFRLSLTTAASSAAFAGIMLHMCGALITR